MKTAGTALRLALAYLLIGLGSALIVYGYTSARPGNPYPNTQHISTTPNPAPIVRK